MEQYEIRVIPALVIWGEGQLRDRIDQTPIDFYRRPKKDLAMPRIQDFQAEFKNAIQQGAEVLVAARAPQMGSPPARALARCGYCDD